MCIHVSMRLQNDFLPEYYLPDKPRTTGYSSRLSWLYSTAILRLERSCIVARYVKIWYEKTLRPGKWALFAVYRVALLLYFCRSQKVLMFREYIL